MIIKSILKAGTILLCTIYESIEKMHSIS